MKAKPNINLHSLNSAIAEAQADLDKAKKDQPLGIVLVKKEKLNAARAALRAVLFTPVSKGANARAPLPPQEPQTLCTLDERGKPCYIEAYKDLHFPT